MKGNKEKFINLANKLHDDKYDYNKFEYVSSKTKGEIICPIHGSFWQTPSTHNRISRPSGCPKCGNENKRLSFEDFVERAYKIHGDKYVYNKEEYSDTKTPIKIFCKKHNHYFTQLPSNHVHITNPTKCPLCSSEIVINKNRDTFNDFIRKANNIHGNKYDYKSNLYVNSITKIDIFCKKM